MSVDTQVTWREVDVRREWSRLPNLITYTRVIMVVPITFLALRPGVTGWIGLVLFGVAALTDKLDGVVAKRNGGALKTKLGALIDPLSDKVLTIWMLIMVARQQGPQQSWVIIATVLIVFRELVVLRVRVGQPVDSAAQAGRFSMLAQSVALGFLLMPHWFAAQDDLARSLLMFAVGASWASGWAYWKARNGGD